MRLGPNLHISSSSNYNLHKNSQAVKKHVAHAKKDSMKKL